jgi:tRNA-2-methylthio-N6-dimethylallyladenosine synthase
VEFDKVHSAAYSTRIGTIADRKFEDNLSLSEKKDRLSALDSMQKEIQTKINSNLLGETTEILVEGIKNGKMFGRNRNDKIVYIENELNNGLVVGTLKNVKITKASPWSLTASLDD